MLVAITETKSIRYQDMRIIAMFEILKAAALRYSKPLCQTNHLNSLRVSKRKGVIMTVKKRSLVTFLLLVVMVMTMSVGYVSAQELEELAPAALNYGYYDFWLSCPAGGDTDLATAREKEATNRNAYYDLTTVTNTTGLSFYVNVRSENGGTVVGEAAERTTTGAFFVNYRSGYGYVGTFYRPSAQTDNDATKPVYIEGSWRP